MLVVCPFSPATTSIYTYGDSDEHLCSSFVCFPSLPQSTPTLTTTSIYARRLSVLSRHYLNLHLRGQRRAFMLVVRLFSLPASIYTHVDDDEHLRSSFVRSLLPLPQSTPTGTATSIYARRLSVFLPCLNLHPR